MAVVTTAGQAQSAIALSRNARIAFGNGTISPQTKAAKGNAEIVCVVALTNIGRFGRTNRSIEQTKSREVLRQRDVARVVDSIETIGLWLAGCCNAGTAVDTYCRWLASEIACHVGVVRQGLRFVRLCGRVGVLDTDYRTRR